MATPEVQPAPVEEHPPVVSEQSDDLAVNKDEVTLEELLEQCDTIEKAVFTKETRYIWRVFSMIPALRAETSKSRILDLINHKISATSPTYAFLLGILAEESAESLESAAANSSEQVKVKRARGDEFRGGDGFVEVEAFIALLSILVVRDERGVQIGHKIAQRAYFNYNRFSNQPTMSLFLSRILYYMCFFAEQSPDQKSDYMDLLFARLKSCEQNSDQEGVATALNLILRQYIRQNAFELAEKLIVRQEFPCQSSNGQAARYLFYLGHVKAIRLEYSASYDALTCALQKAPDHGSIGFRQIVTKFMIVVKLLLSDIPEKNVFRHPDLMGSLKPYFKLVLSVRRGSIAEFNAVVAEYSEQFAKDATDSLISRLRHNVIRSGIRNIGLAYSKITMQDVALKLQIDSDVEAELMVAKAICNNLVPGGKIDHVTRVLTTEDDEDIYSSLEPYKIFRPRIAFCLMTYRKCVEALRFPPKKYYEDLADAEERNRLEYARRMTRRGEEEFDEEDSGEEDSDDTLM